MFLLFCKSKVAFKKKKSHDGCKIRKIFTEIFLLCMLMWKEPRSHCLDTAIMAYLETGECLVACFDTCSCFHRRKLKNGWV